MESKSNGSKPRTRSAPSSALDVEAREAGPTDSPSPKRVFVVSPIGSPGTDVYKRAAYALKFIFKRALPAPEWEVHRADEGKLSDSIGQHVIRSIMEADLIIADLTGHNPNVFYELAVAHASRKPVVHLISKGERLPFDVFDQRTIHYDISDLESVEEAVEEVRAYAEAVLGKSDEVVNPLTNYEAFDRIRGSDASGQGASDAVADLLEQIVARLSNLEQSVANRGRREFKPERVTEDYSVEVISSKERALRAERDYMRQQAIRERLLRDPTSTVEDLGRITKQQMDGESRHGSHHRGPESNT